ncbi:ABC transporter substrate-binding protein [Bifidobacterium sp. ESL0732]|uniref:ABC transporter substrate-binding protein n=1 Tax=Bifidobacterium sp. ESL0732 TaxID=2983222 RepID=UPI0023F7990C|nr:ABC transporter substrate-binding protein [Bifidobacterium sp. ESL0732]WEV64394.1 ABC transporter substrate-binding protein [Bifidobacterium sp. ESL0732]
MRKRMMVSAALAVTLVAGLSLSGCGNPAAGGNNSADTDTSAAGYWPDVTTKLDGVKLTFWVGQSDSKVPVKAISDFEKATGAKIDLQIIPDSYENNVQTKITTGDMPDLATWEPTNSMLAGFVSTGKLQQLDHAPWVKNYIPGVADLGQTKGHRYATLISPVNVMGVWYNKNVFKKAGITANPKGWNELVSDAQKIKDTHAADSPFFEMGGSQWGTQWAVQVQLAEAAKKGLWERVNTGKEKFTDPTIMNAINNYKKLIDEGYYNSNAGSATLDDQAAALWKGKTGMVIGNNAQFNVAAALAGNDKKAIDESLGFFPISSEGNISSLSPGASSSVVAFKTGDKKREAAARQFLAFWMSKGYKDFVNNRKLVSALKTVKSPEGVPQALLDAADSIGDSAPSMQSAAIANPDLYINLANMINGTSTPEKVAESTQNQFAQIAKAQGAKGF